MKIIKLRRNKGRVLGIRKYAKVRSSTHKDREYIVVKLRIPGTANYTHQCSCPGYMYRQKPCKHIRAFKEQEIRNANHG